VQPSARRPQRQIGTQFAPWYAPPTRARAAEAARGSTILIDGNSALQNRLRARPWGEAPQRLRLVYRRGFLEISLSVLQAARAAACAALARSVEDGVDGAFGSVLSEVEAVVFGPARRGWNRALSWSGVTKNFPATRAGAKRPARISVRKRETVMGNSIPKTATASARDIGALSGHSAGDGRVSLLSTLRRLSKPVRLFAER
jgi:hypothetical protein